MSESHRLLTASAAGAGAEGLTWVPAGVAAADLRAAMASLDEALGLWRGTPYVELEEAPAAVAERARLEELRTVALEDRAVAALALGEHAMVAAELESLTARYPLRERLWGLRALALARAGGRPTRSRRWRQVRTVLDEELGLEPGAELRSLQTAVLRQEPALAWAPPPGAEVVEVTTVGGDRAVCRGPWRAAAAVAAGRARPPAGAPGRRVVPRGGGRADVRCGDRRTWHRQVAAVRGARRSCHRPAEGGCSSAAARRTVEPPRCGRGNRCSSSSVSSSRRVARRTRARSFGCVRAWPAGLRTPPWPSRVLLVLEDLHWADVASLRVLRMLVDTVASGRLLVLATWRSRPRADRRAGGRRGVAGPSARGAHRAGRARPRDIAAVVGSVASVVPDGEQSQRLADRTDGNPFFVVEYARLAREGGDLTALLDGADPPTAVTDVLSRRLARLPDDTRALLRWAAVLGRRFPLADLAAVAELAEDDVLDRLDPAVDAGLVREVGADGFSFAHALVRDTVTAATSPARLARVHARSAEVLEARPGRESEVAGHWQAAGPAYTGRAWRAAAAAGGVARRRHASDAAVELFTRRTGRRRAGSRRDRAGPLRAA